jgi:hypothetical protein
MLVADLDGDGHVLDLAEDRAADGLTVRRAPITAADLEAVRRDLAAWTGDLVGWLER